VYNPSDQSAIDTEYIDKPEAMVVEDISCPFILYISRMPPEKLSPSLKLMLV